MTVNQAVRGVFADSTDDVIRLAIYHAACAANDAATSCASRAVTYFGTVDPVYDATYAAALDATLDATYAATRDATRRATARFRSSQ